MFLASASQSACSPKKPKLFTWAKRYSGGWTLIRRFNLLGGNSEFISGYRLRNRGQRPVWRAFTFSPLCDGWTSR